MDCIEAKKHLSEYVDDVLDPNTKKALEDHLSGCKACTREAVALRSLISELNTLDIVEAPDDFLENLHKRMKRSFSFKSFFKLFFTFTPRRMPLQLASMTVMALLVVMVWNLQKKEKPVVDFIKSTPAIKMADTTDNEKIMALEKEEALSASEPAVEKATAGSSEAEKRPIEIVLLLNAKPSLKKAAAEEFDKPVSSTARKSRSRVLSEQAKVKTEQVAGKTKGGKRKQPLPLAKPDEAPDGLSYMKNELNEIRMKINELIRSFDGSVLPIDEEEIDETSHVVYAHIPSENFQSFSEQLIKIGSFQVPSHSQFKTKDQATVRVIIRMKRLH